MLCFALNMHTWVFNKLDQLDQRQQEVQREKSKPKIKPKQKQNQLCILGPIHAKNPPAVYFEPKLASVPRIRSLCTSSKARKKSATPKKRIAAKSKTEFCHRKMQPWSHFKRVHRTFSFFFQFFLTFSIWNRQRKTQVLYQESLGLNP